MNARNRNHRLSTLAAASLTALTLTAGAAYAGTGNPLIVLGGSGTDTVNDVARDAVGNFYVVGVTNSPDFPIVGGFQSTERGGWDGFLVKLDPTASKILYSTYLGGSRDDKATGVAVDSSGNVYVAGTTASTDFPTTTYAYDTHCGTDGACDGGRSDIFVTKFSPAFALVYSTYVGGSGFDETIDERKCIAVDSSGRAIVVGRTTSQDFPTASALQPQYGGGASDAVVFGLGARGQWLFFSTYLGGSGADTAETIALGPQGYYVAGETGSPDFPVSVRGAQYGGGPTDAFVTVITSTFALGPSTFIGGSRDEMGAALAVDAAGTIWLAGTTRSADLPVENATQWTLAGGQDMFLAHFSAQLGLLSSTYQGGSGDDFVCWMGVDGAGNVTVTGKTTSMDFPQVNPLQAGFGGGMYDGTMTLWTSGASQLARSTYLGGDLDECIKGIFPVIGISGGGPAPMQIALGNYMASGGESPNGAMSGARHGRPDGGQPSAGHGFVAAIN